ncbi:MAG TPA: serine/threonine-protein kinase, partial [Ardenticatenaceae bacterium]|nr:serine/threonine-protein kinase [Ardenticatenaceae bacterium]
MDLTGKTLGKYQVQEKLGQGGMGAVYKAYDPDLDRTAAVKILPPGLATDPHFLERFRLEARAVARLDHPNIAAVFAAGEENGVYYLVMEYIQGGSLADLIRRESPVPVERTLELLEQAARALDYAHARGIVHRDIKPNNILIDGEGCAQLVDFGLVKVSEVSLTVAGQIFGTPAYMAPEQIEGNDVGPPADIYALGVVAYEMLAGKVPFQGPM